MGRKNRSKKKKTNQNQVVRTIQKNRFNKRQYNRDKHKKPLASPDEDFQEIVKKMNSLFENVFFDHNAVYSLGGHEEWNSKRKLAYNFFNSEKYYSLPEIKCAQDNKNVTPDEFIRKVFEDSSHGNKNKISYLLGKVGRGKTAYINYLITKHLPARKNSLIFIRFDVETNNIINSENPIQLIVERISEQLIDIISKRFIELKEDNNLKDYIKSFESELKKENRDFNKLKSYLKEIASRMPSKFVIIIDNLDILYQNIKRGFYRDGSNNFYQILNKVIKSFIPTNDNDLDSLHANILFVMREETYDYVRMLNHKESTSTISHHFNDNNLYEMQEYDWSKIIKGRFDMLVDLVNQNKEKYDDYDQILKHIEKVNDYLNNKEIGLLEKIKKLANSGLREMMRYLNQYSYTPYLNIERFIHNEPVGIMAYILKGKRLYSNEESDITNIYSNDLNEKMKMPTYWLKYVLVKYLEERRNIQTELNDIYHIFSPVQNGYTKDQVNNVIDELSNSNESNMIDIKQVYDPLKDTTKTFLTITEKGLYLIKNVVDKFYYLQLIVDDPSLILPDLYLKESLFNYENSDDYSYILLQGDKYSAAASSVIRKKGQAVILFLTLLKFSLIAEKKEYRTVFNNLNHLLIDVDININSIKEELHKIYSSKSKDKKLIPFTEDFDSYVNEIDINSINMEAEIKKLYHIRP